MVEVKVRSITVLLLTATHTALKFQLRSGKTILARGKFARLGMVHPFFEITTDDEPYSESVRATTHRQALRTLIDHLQRNSVIKALRDIELVIHHVPHGGTVFHKPHVMHQEDVRKLEAISFLSPDLPASIAVLHAAMSQLAAPHVAVFDTAFTSTLPLEAALYPVPEKLAQKFHLRRYGFNGILHQGAYAAAKPQLGKSRRVLSILLHEDVSITAIVGGVAVDTTTGFTPAEGLPGLHRVGSLDPRIPLHFAMHLGASAHHIDQLFSTRCGIAGMTEKTSYAAITAAATKDAACVDALMLLSYRTAQAAAGMAMAMGGVDAIVFSGDPDSWAVQEEICKRLSFLGVKAQRRAHKVFSAPRSKVKVIGVYVSADDALYAQGMAAVGK